MRYNKKNVKFLLVPLLIIIFSSGNATANTYSFSFSVSSTFGDRDIFNNFTVNSVGTINGEATWTGSAAYRALILPPEKPTPFIYTDIVSSPQGAQVWIDGEYCGVTPFRKYFDRPGNHTFKLILNGYQPYQESFYISESMTKQVTLKPLQTLTPTTAPDSSHTTPSTPGFLALSLLIELFFVYFFMFKNKR